MPMLKSFAQQRPAHGYSQISTAPDSPGGELHRPSTGCVFCDIIADKEHHRILYHDSKVYAIYDKSPAARRHILVIPVEHVGTLLSLQRGPEDYDLVKRMHQVGRDLLQKELPHSKQRFGFHRPPFNSVDHLHLHCFALPFQPWWKRLRYIPLGPLFVPVDKALKKLRSY
eukprot:jgi/Mesvir1/18251/Mv09526-RA.1